MFNKELKERLEKVEKYILNEKVKKEMLKIEEVFNVKINNSLITPYFEEIKIYYKKEKIIQKCFANQDQILNYLKVECSRDISSKLYYISKRKEVKGDN